MTWSEIKPGSKGGVRSAGVKDAEKPVPLRARVFEGREVSRAWTFASYTSLTSTWSHSPRDRDAVAVEAPPIEQDLKTIFAFPPGARTGIVWHSLFEQLNFGAGDEELRTIANGIPKRAGAPAELAPAGFGMMKSALVRPITPDGGRLCDLSNDRCIRELEFTFSLPAFRTDAVVKVLQNPANKLHLPFREASSALARMDLSGFMTGAIDLLFEWNGKYYIADYKSNNLGGTPERYAAGPLADVMAREQYYLQYLIYAVAVDRFLSQKLPGYEYERHFGGVAYLFLRGIAADGDAGVFFDRPDRALIDALEAALCGGRVS
jgi:exodeoxyribonuclease V beta subunit